MISKDTLWKGIIEDLAEDFLLFFFPEYAHLMDFLQGFAFIKYYKGFQSEKLSNLLEKELDLIYQN